MASVPKIEAGYRVGQLTVCEKTNERKNGYIVWRCTCSCGGDIFLDTRCLQRGTVRDCGCVRKVRPGMLDLTGQRFGRLVCVTLSDEKDAAGGTQWVCRCDCGTLCLASVHQLRSGYRRSCGCMSRPPRKNYVGMRFSRLTVIEYAGKRDGMHRWKCRCDCGNETIVGQTPLQTGRTKSCGCLNRQKLSDDPQYAEQRGFVGGTSVPAIKARMNCPPIVTNTSGYNGVYRSANGKWSAQITFKGKTYYLGSYAKIEDAIKARKRSEEMYEDFLESYYSDHPCAETE